MYNQKIAKTVRSILPAIFVWRCCNDVVAVVFAAAVGHFAVGVVVVVVVAAAVVATGE